MNKLRLNIDDLRVDSFTTHAVDDAYGTVHAHISGAVLCRPKEPGGPFDRTEFISCRPPCGFQSHDFNCTLDESCHGCPVSEACPTRFICPIDHNPR